MNTETRAPARAARKEGALVRWIIRVFVVGLLLLGGYKGALWLQANRDTVLPALRQPPFAPPGTGAQPPSASGQIGAQPPARPGASQPGNEPLAPAVLGGAGVHPCTINGQTTYTSRPCPPGSTANNSGISGVSAQPGRESPPAAGDSQAAREAQCGYLAAETTRLGHEFDQLLPPPVLDQIAGRLKALRERSAQLKCASDAAPQAASAPARPRPRPPA